ncbi:MAG TPA: DUF1573 domain-containing protein [Pirellulales bacterium]|jgi:hypothetical protein|nr:DUF1573 domain-containing protein [Pirellulales bacterium]
MRHWVLIVLAILFGAGFGLGITVMELGASLTSTVDASMAMRPTAASLQGPHVVPDQEEYNFGSMERESHKSHVFTIRNDGHAPLILKKGETTCRCTKFEIAETDLKPGDSTAVTLEWKARDVNPGAFRQSATIETNDPARPQLTFTISGDVTSSYRVNPTALAFSSISASEPHTADINIYSYRSGQLAVDSHEFTESSTADKFEFRAEPMPASTVQEEKNAQSGVVAHVTVKPGLPLGAFRQKIHIHLNQEEEALEVPIEGNTIADVVIAGRNWDDDHSLLTLGTVSGPEGATAELFIVAHGTHRNDLHPKIKSVKPEMLKVSLGDPQGGTGDSPVRIPIKIEIPPGTRPMLHLGGEEGKLGEILISTDLPEAQTIRILVRFAVGE